MKRIKVLLIVIFIISIGSSLQRVTAQEKTKEENEQEQKIQQAIELEKKAMVDQKKVLDLQAKEIEKVTQETNRIVRRANDSMNFYKFRVRNSGNALQRFDLPFNGAEGEPFSLYLGRSGDSERTTWDFSKSVKDNTFSRDFTFDVEKTVNTVIMSVMGDCKTGDIRIKIVMPNGKSYSDILIDESGNLNWRKSFIISDEENKDKVGEWKFRIETEKATGFFKISLQTY